MPGKLRHSSLIVILGVAAACVAWVYLFFLPRMRATASIHDRINEKQDFIAEAPKLATAITSAQSELIETQTYIAAHSKRLTSQSELTSLFGRISRLARENETKITRFEPQSAVDYLTISKLPVLFSVQGSFDNIQALLGSMEQLPAAVWFEEVKIAALRENSKAVECNLMLEIFVDNNGKSN